MGKLGALLDLFRKGSEVTNAAAWTNATIIANFLGALVTVAITFGWIKTPIDNDTVLAIAAGIAAAVNVGVHLVTDARVGLPAKRGADGDSGSVASAPGSTDVNGG